MSPYRARLRPHLDPRRPLARHDAHDVRQVLAALDRPFRDRDPFQIGKAILSALRRLAAHATARRYLIKGQLAPARAVNLIRDDARIGNLAGREHAGHDRRHGPGRCERATAMDGFFPIGRALRPWPREPAMKPAGSAIDDRPRPARDDLARSIAGDQLGIGRTVLYQPRVEQRGAGLQGRAHRCTPFATRIAWTASSADRSNRCLSAGTTGRGQFSRFSAYQRPARVAAGLALW